MANIVIKKRVNLDFLGEEYKEDFLVFKSIPVKEYKTLMTKRPQAQDSSQIDFIIGVLKENFISGKFNGEEVEAKDVEDFDAEVTVICFKKLTGQDIDPKV